MKLANVYIEHSSLSLDQCFSYSFEGMNVLPGTRVWVPFRSMKLIGFVDSLSEISDEEVQRLSYQIRPVLSVIDEKPLLTEELMTLGKWMAQYYAAPTISCYQSMLPKVLRPKQNKAKIVMEKIAVYDHSIENDRLRPDFRNALPLTFASAASVIFQEQDGRSSRAESLELKRILLCS